MTAKETFMKLFTAFAMHDDVAARKLIADDAVWQFPGRDGQLAGDHAGVEAIIGFLHKVRDLTGGTFVMAPEGDCRGRYGGGVIHRLRRTSGQNPKQLHLPSNEIL